MNGQAHVTDEWTTAVPETYCIEYGRDHLGNAECIAQIAAAPPTVVHVGVDTVINNMFGATDGDMHCQRQLAPAGLEARARDIRAFINEMHAAGVKTLMPYQSGMFCFGDHEKRSVFWEFYDRWDDYADFGIGPRPATDPVEWPGNDRRPVPPRRPTVFIRMTRAVFPHRQETPGPAPLTRPAARDMLREWPGFEPARRQPLPPAKSSSCHSS